MEGKAKKFKKIRIDSRLVKKGDLFIAIKGKEKDGHQYVADVLKKHPSVIIVSKLEKQWQEKEITILQVENTMQAMLTLAHYYRSCYPIPVIAITGSVGKTTAKELLYEILKTTYQVKKSIKNYNNRIGVALTLFELEPTDQLLVLEFGMNHKKEIEELSKLCHPDISMITNIGTAHIGFLNGKKNIAKAKLEILKGMDSGYFIKNPDDPYLKKVTSNQVEVLNPKKDSQLYFTNIKLFQTKTSALLHYHDNVYPVMIPIPGKRILETIIMVIQVGLLFQISIEQMLPVLESFELPEGRGNLFPCCNNVTLIDDTYNASLESLENNLIMLKLSCQSKYLIFGDFLELGTYAKKIHKQAAKKIKKISPVNVLLIGPYAKKMKKYLKGSLWFSNVDEALSYLKKQELKDCTILVKGSRKMHLDKIVTYFKKKKIK